MATYISMTTSNSPEITNPDILTNLLDEWEFVPYHGTITATVDDGQLKIYGEAGFEPVPHDALPDDEEEWHVEPELAEQERFLEELLPYLEEELVIQTIGHEKLRYPFTGNQYIADPATDRVISETFYDRREAHSGETPS